MQTKALLDRSAELLHAVLKFDKPADAVVSAFVRQRRELGPRERQLLADAAYAVLRYRLRFAHFAQSGKGPIERRLAIVGWQGDATVLEAALLPTERLWLAAIRAIDVATLPKPLHHNLPEWLAAALREELDETQFNALADALLQPAPLDLRVNTVKTRRDAVLQGLSAAGIEALPTPYSPWGLRIQGRAVLDKLDLYRDGAFEIQDEGSQLLALLVEAKRGETVVDFCAGAGGKTLALGECMRNTGRLYAFDTSGHRLQALKPRLARSGLTNVHTLQLAHEHDARIARMSGKAHRVLVDAPCSGLGTLRRNPDLKWRQTPQTIAALCAQQQSILDSAARLVQPGGRLVYATCSLLAIENQAIAQIFEQSHPGFQSLDANDVLMRGGVEQPERLVSEKRMRLWPHRHATDGFFAAIWQRD